MPDNDFDALRAGDVVTRTWPLHDTLPEGERRLVRLRVPSLADRFAYEARLEACGVDGATMAQIDERRRAAIALLPGIDAAARAAFDRLLDAEIAAGQAIAALPADATDAEREAAGLAPQQLADVARLERLLRAADPLYAEMHEQRELRHRLHLYHAARAIAVGWQNFTDVLGNPVAWATGADGRVDDAALLRLDRLQLQWIGVRAAALFYPTAADAKNSAAPSG